MKPARYPLRIAWATLGKNMVPYIIVGFVCASVIFKSQNEQLVHKLNQIGIIETKIDTKCSSKWQEWMENLAQNQTALKNT